MTDVIQLPGAASEPPPRANHWRGKYPSKNIVPAHRLRSLRYDRDYSEGRFASPEQDENEIEARRLERLLATRRAENQRVRDVLRELKELADAGRLYSLIFIAEQDGRQKALSGITGRLRSDPLTSIGHLQVMQYKLASFVVEKEED